MSFIHELFSIRIAQTFLHWTTLFDPIFWLLSWPFVKFVLQLFFLVVLLRFLMGLGCLNPIFSPLLLFFILEARYSIFFIANLAIMLSRLNLHRVDVPLLDVFEIRWLIAVVVFGLGFGLLWLHSFFLLSDFGQSHIGEFPISFFFLLDLGFFNFLGLIEGSLDDVLILIHDLIDFVELLNKVKSTF